MSTHNDTTLPVATELLVASLTPDLSFSYRNEAWLSLFGGNEKKWSGLNEEDERLVQQFLHDAAAGVLVTNRVFFVSLENRDQPLPVLLQFIPVSFPQKEGEGPSICVTVTGEVLAEPGSWVLNQTQRIRVENVGRMTLGLIHEINNMLTNVLGNLELIELSPMLAEERSPMSELLSTIKKAALDGASMTKSIKRYIRNEKTSSFELLDIPSIIEECLTFTRPYWLNEPRRKGIEIELIKQIKPVPRIMGSVVELKEVFINLITNAVQAMPRGGKLIFSTDVDEHDRIVVKIKDTGNGMSDRVKHRIFEPMFTTKGKQGTGMGLPICQSIMQNHDATIKVETALGQGTTFILSFLAASEQSIEKAIHPAIQRDTCANVLAVDDEPGVRNILANLLQTRGHAVYVASSGYEALDQLNANKIDIVFTDHGMPEMNGQQLAKAIRQSNPDLPVVLVTGDTEFDQHLEEIGRRYRQTIFLGRSTKSDQRTCYCLKQAS